MRSLIIAILVAPAFAFANQADLAAEAKKVACLDELQGYEFATNRPTRVSDMIQVRNSKGELFAWDGHELHKYARAEAPGYDYLKRDQIVWKRENSTLRRSGKVSRAMTTAEIDDLLGRLITTSMSSFAASFEKSGYRVGKGGAIGRNFHISRILNSCAAVAGPKVLVRQPVKLKSGTRLVSKAMTLEQYRRFAFALRPALGNQQLASNSNKAPITLGAQ